MLPLQPFDLTALISLFDEQPLPAVSDASGYAQAEHCFTVNVRKDVQPFPNGGVGGELSPPHLRVEVLLHHVLERPPHPVPPPVEHVGAPSHQPPAEHAQLRGRRQRESDQGRKAGAGRVGERKNCDNEETCIKEQRKEEHLEKSDKYVEIKRWARVSWGRGGLIERREQPVINSE